MVGNWVKNLEKKSLKKMLSKKLLNRCSYKMVG